MAIVLLLRPAGLFGRLGRRHRPVRRHDDARGDGVSAPHVIAFLVMTTALVAAPFFVYPVFLMRRSASRCSPRLQSLIGYVGSSRSATRSFSARRLRRGALGEVWGSPELAISLGTAAATVLGVASARWPSAARHLLREHHVRVRPDGLSSACRPLSPAASGIQSVPRGCSSAC